MFRARSGWIQFAKRGQLVGGRAFCHTNNKLTTNADHNAYASVRDYEAYRQLDKLDFMTAAKILFTTPPKKKKFGSYFGEGVLNMCLSQGTSGTDCFRNLKTRKEDGLNHYQKRKIILPCHL